MMVKDILYMPDHSLPPDLTNKSLSAVADIDKDGDIDLFVGAISRCKNLWNSPIFLFVYK